VGSQPFWFENSLPVVQRKAYGITAFWRKLVRVGPSPLVRCSPCPPLVEQHEIVRRVEALLKLADAIEKRVEVATKPTSLRIHSCKSLPRRARPHRSRTCSKRRPRLRTRLRPPRTNQIRTRKIRHQRPQAPPGDCWQEVDYALHPLQSLLRRILIRINSRTSIGN